MAQASVRQQAHKTSTRKRAVRNLTQKSTLNQRLPAAEDLQQPNTWTNKPQTLLNLQRTIGNRAVMRLMESQKNRGSMGNAQSQFLQRFPLIMGQRQKPKVEGEECLVEAEKSKLIQREDTEPALPTGPAWNKSKQTTPTFTLDKPAAVRSNTDSSTTQAATAALPTTFTGKAAVDAKRKSWRYQLDTIESKGKIQIVYYTNDRYPAPTPTDDSGTLSNVTDANWKAIVKDLKKNRKGIADFWSAYQAEDLHEDYHWVNEWQKLAKKGIKTAEKAIAKLKIGFDKAATAADAEVILKPQATTIFDDAIKAARKKWLKMSDSPGAAPYKAQAPALDKLRKRVVAFAKEKKWDKKKKT